MPIRRTLAVIALAPATLAPPALHAQRSTLPATPATVVWGYYSAKAKPVLTVHSGDTVRIQTLSICGSTERLIGEGVAAQDIPSYNAAIYREVKDKGPRGHILTGPVDVAEAEPGDVLEVDILKIDFLVEEKHLSRDEAYMLTSVAVDVDITQLVDGNVGVHAMCPKTIFVK